MITIFFTRKASSLIFYFLILILPFHVHATEYDISLALQIKPTLYAHQRYKNRSYEKVDQLQLQEMATREALEYFKTVKSFSPSEPANYFIRLQLTYGYFNKGVADPDVYCVALTHEDSIMGGFGVYPTCEDSVEDAIEVAFEKLVDEKEDFLGSIDESKRRFIWLDAVDKGITFDKNNKVVIKVLRKSLKENVRALLSQYFQGENSEPINFYKSDDLIPVIMNSYENITEHEKFLKDIIDRARKKNKMWPFYLHQAVRVNAPIDIIKAIGEKKNFNYDLFLDADGNTPLMHAVWSENLQLTKFFLNEKSDPKIKNNSNIGVIHYAATASPLRKDFKLLDLALKQGLNINDVSNDGVFPLAMAIAVNGANGSPIDGARLVDYYKKHGSSIDLPAKARGKASSPILQAVYFEEHGAGQRLLKYSADIEYHTKNGPTPLQQAASNKDLYFVKALLAAGAKPNVRGAEKKTALHLAYPKPEEELSSNIKKIINLLVSHGADQSIIDDSRKTAEQSYLLAREAYLEEQRILAYNKKMREIKEEQERLAQEERARRHREAKAEERKNGFNWGKAMAMTAGFIAGNGLKLDAEAQADTISGIIRDSQAGVSGISNTTGALNNSTQRYKRESASQQRAAYGSNYSSVSRAGTANGQDYSNERYASKQSSSNSSETWGYMTCTYYKNEPGYSGSKPTHLYSNVYVLQEISAKNSITKSAEQKIKGFDADCYQFYMEDSWNEQEASRVRNAKFNSDKNNSTIGSVGILYL